MDASARLTMLTRLGFAARGLLYIVIGFLVIGAGRAEDPAGALAYLGRGGGSVLLSLVAVGLAAYGVWRLADAIFDVERHGDSGKGLAERAGAATSGLIHLFLAWQAVRLVRGAASASGGGAESGAQTALSLPGGGLLLGLGGVVLIGVGVYQLVKAAKASFLKHLEPAIARQAWAKWTGRLGHAARGLIFLISGFFLVRAALSEEASEAGGMAQALSWLSHPWNILVAVGLIGFGLFSLIEARFRILHDVPVDQLSRRAGRAFR